MKKLLIIFASLLACAVCARAIPAYPRPVTVTQPDGSKLTIRMHGDEFGHWYTDDAGRIVAQDSKGYFRALPDDTPYKAAERARKNRELRMSAAGLHKEAAVTGKRHYLVILVEFKDLAFKTSNPRQAFTDLLNQQGYSVGGATGSARDYYFDNSDGLFEPVFDVYGPVKLSNNMKYYGGNDSRGDDKAPHTAVAEGCRLLKDEIDFSRYDNDGDGEVDMVFMYYAGYGEADTSKADTIWPHQWSINYGGEYFSDDGTAVNDYACSSELAGYGGKTYGSLTGIGAACHEFAHAMGLPDFYDSDGETNGYAAALFDFSLMCGGCYNNGSCTPPYLNTVEKAMLGWISMDSVPALPGRGNVVLRGVQTGAAYVTPTDMEDEFFLYECRGSEGWDAYLPAHGMLVYHVDKSTRRIRTSSGTMSAKNMWKNWHRYNNINTNGSHPCFYIVPAADQDNLQYGLYSYRPDDGIPFPGRSKVEEYCAISWNNVPSEWTLSGISYGGGEVSFSVAGKSSPLAFNTIADPGEGSYAVGDKFEFAVEDSSERPYTSVKWYFDGEAVTETYVVLSSGYHTVEAELQLENGKKDLLTLELQVR